MLTILCSPDKLPSCCRTHVVDSDGGLVSLRSEYSPPTLATCERPLKTEVDESEASADESIPRARPGWHGGQRSRQPRWMTDATPREKMFLSKLRLPHMRRYPVPPGCSEKDPEEARVAELLRMFQEFVLDLHKGLNLTQLTNSQGHSDMHCQIGQDLQTLKVDQGCGCIVEFPLCAVCKVYRIIRSEDKWFSPVGFDASTGIEMEHIVVVDFLRRKLAFVMPDALTAQCFLLNMVLLIRKARECRVQAGPLTTDRSPSKSGRSNSGFIVRGKRASEGDPGLMPSMSSFNSLVESATCTPCEAEPCPR